MTARLQNLQPWFRHINVTPTDWIGHFGFCVPTDSALERWSNYPPAALPEGGRAGGGRGLRQSESEISALAEAVEIASCCEWGDEKLERARTCDIEENVWLADWLNGFSQDQIENRRSWNRKLRRLDTIPEPAKEDVPVDWIAARSLMDETPVWIPADYALIGRNSNKAESVCIADTNGCAAGESLEHARLSALCELVERDATGRWWYGGRVRPRVKLNMMPEGEEIEQHLLSRGRKLILLDITTDLGVPTVAALACDTEGSRPAAGFASRFTFAAATRSALLEMLQIDMNYVLENRHRNEDPKNSSGAQRSLHEIAHFIYQSDDFGSDHPSMPDFNTCIRRLSESGIDVAEVDMTREVFGVPVVRLVSPQLCHWKPRFGKVRLLSYDKLDLGRSWELTVNPHLLSF